uniref:Rap-GAP domain-containing protein n=1 Tax=Strigamia maritima TaxID=126957 RepID=T1J194_STRMM
MIICIHPISDFINFSNMDKLEKGPKEVFAPEIQKDLLLLEEQEGSVNFKFGILYVHGGQTVDDEMYSNENGSVEFDKFINLLGDRVKLKGWDKYRGGLDVKGDMTGQYSTYTIYEGHEIMFHISTLLPYSRDNKQQVERKRHIGNDIVNIIFIDGEYDDIAPFKPAMVRSQFTHVFAVVTYNSNDDSYRLAVYSEESVPLFGPTLPSKPVFHNPQEFREFLIKATFNTPIFAQKRERTLEMLIKDLYTEYTAESKTTTTIMLNRRALSDVLPDAPRGSRRKEEARQVEFALKLDTIVKGDAPTSLATTSLFKREPWEPQCFYPDFPCDIVCGDSLNESKLILATENGIYIADDSHIEGMNHRLIFDKTVVVKQLNVVEAHGILLFRMDKGRDCKVCVFRLSDFEGNNNIHLVRNRNDLKDHKLERSRGCHLYAISRPGGSHLRMVVAVGRKLLLLQWRHSAAWTAWCPSSDTDTVEGFQFIRELPVAEQPVLLTLVDSSTPGGDNQICVGYKHQFDLINEKNGDTLRLFQADGSKLIHLVTAIDVYEDDEAELLLCYNHTCHFQKLSEDNSTEFDFSWNSVPEAIVCAFPYILAFTSDSIEIRLVINGNLVHTMVMPTLRLITSKNDIYFATTAPEFIQMTRERVKVDKLERDPSLSPPPSPLYHQISGFTTPTSQESKPFRIYKIAFENLTGVMSAEQRPPTPQPGKENNRTSTQTDFPSKTMHLRVVERPEGGSRSGPSSPTPGHSHVSLLSHVPPSPQQRGLSKEGTCSPDSDSGLGKSLGPTPPASPPLCRVDGVLHSNHYSRKENYQKALRQRQTAVYNWTEDSSDED